MVHGPIMETQKKGKESERYLFWTSVDTDKVGANKQIPVIISTADGKFLHFIINDCSKTKNVVLINHM